MEHINTNPEFKKINEPLRNVGREIAENQQRLAEIHNELLRLSTSSINAQSAWSSYLNPLPDAGTKRSDLRGEAERVEARLEMLKGAQVEGNQQVDIVRNKLSRSPCEQSRPSVIVQIRKILAALDQITAANAALRSIRAAIEDGGFKSSALPPAELNLQGHDDSYRSYIKHHFPEIAK
jgi:chromosome segregation ATPase